MSTNLLEATQKFKKAREGGAFEVEDLLTSVAWTDTIKPEFDKLLTLYYRLLTEATLSSEDIEITNPLSGIPGKVSPVELAARIEGLRFALAFLEKKLKEANKNRMPLGG